MQIEQPKSLIRLRDKQKELTERIRQLEARAKQKTRKLETRRKVLLGALLSSWAQEDAELEARVSKALPSFLTRQIDRDVFGLAPLSPDAKKSSSADGAS